MNPEERLVCLKLYLSRRGVGHTTAMIEGARNYQNAIVLVKHRHEEKFINQMADRRLHIASWDNVEALRGLKVPLLIDNNAMSAILDDAFHVITKLRSENHVQAAEIHDYKEYTNKLRDENRMLYAEIEKLKKRKSILQMAIDKLKSKKNGSPGKK